MPAEDFSKLFTVERKMSKGWEVVDTANSLNDAVISFKNECLTAPLEPVRLTTPTDESIYW